MLSMPYVVYLAQLGIGVKMGSVCYAGSHGDSNAHTLLLHLPILHGSGLAGLHPGSFAGAV